MGQASFWGHASGAQTEAHYTARERRVQHRENGINPDRPWDATGAVWTVAYRKRTGPVFHRVTNWAGTWHQAEDMARRLMVARPDLQVWYVPTLAYEQANPGHEDNGTVLTDSGKRVKIRDNGTLPEGLLIPAPVETDASQDAYIDEILYADDPDAPYGWVTDYLTGERIRAATQQEWQCSVDSYHEHGAYLDGTDVVFVAGGPERETEYDREADYWGQHRGE